MSGPSLARWRRTRSPDRRGTHLAHLRRYGVPPPKWGTCPIQDVSSCRHVLGFKTDQPGAIVGSAAIRRTPENLIAVHHALESGSRIETGASAGHDRRGKTKAPPGLTNPGDALVFAHLGLVRGAPNTGGRRQDRPAKPPCSRGTGEALLYERTAVIRRTVPGERVRIMTCPLLDTARPTGGDEMHMSRRRTTRGQPTGPPGINRREITSPVQPRSVDGVLVPPATATPSVVESSIPPTHRHATVDEPS